MLKSLILWSLHASEVVSTEIKQAYKQTRREDDRNQPKAIQPWFSDTWRRKYYLIEGQDDTQFRIYRENDGKTAKTNAWFSVAGSKEEAEELAIKLETEMPGVSGSLVGQKIRAAYPRWEAGAIKRQKRESRKNQKDRWRNPVEYGSYEGRTRGRRMRYNYDNLDDDGFDESSRAASGRSSPVDDSRPVITASGRQVKSRVGGTYGESILTDQRREIDRERPGNSEDTDDMVGVYGRSHRKSIPTQRALATRGRFADGLESGSETDEAAEPSADEWSENEEEADDESEPEAENSQESDDELMDDADDNTQESLVVQLRYRKGPPGSVLANGTGSRKGTPLREVQTVEVNGSDEVEPTASTDISQQINGHANEKPTIILPNGQQEMAIGQTLQENVQPSATTKIDVEAPAMDTN